MWTRRSKLDGDWPRVVQEWKARQQVLASRVIVGPLEPMPRFVGGADVAFSVDGRTVLAVALVFDAVEGTVIEIREATARADVPYVPGYLSFREGPALLEAIGALRHRFDVICFDGQGQAHPRRCGLATHMGVTLDVPSVGVAKSRLIGTYDEPPREAGSASALMDGAEQVGVVLRTKRDTRPLFVSVGHRVDLASARRLVLACCQGYRVPEPTRQADIEVGKLKRSGTVGKG